MPRFFVPLPIRRPMGLLVDMTRNYNGCRATIMGLGHFGGGLAAARWLARQGAVVSVTDQADERALADSLANLADVPIARYRFGGHCADDFRDANLVVVNPAVRPDSPWLDVARRSGAWLRTELELFLENCPGRTIGVTGSNGKSTTAAMIASILRADGVWGDEATAGNKPPSPPAPLPLAGEGGVFLGGNIGGSLLEQLAEIKSDDWVVLEISSFQLWHFSPSAKMPHVAVVTGCTPNHLDWHGDFTDYVLAKQRLLAGQSPDNFAVLNTFDAEVASWAKMVRGRCVPLPDWDTLPRLPVAGEHHRINALCAAAAATAVGCAPDVIRQGLEQFSPLPQRLERFAVVEGRVFLNDSTATTPESTIAALRSMDRPVWLIAGGKNKGFDFSRLASEIAQTARGAAFFGAAGDELYLRTTAKRADLPCIRVVTMEDALRWCWAQSQPGDAILLSPACASTDQFRNFRQRGECFVELVEKLERSCRE